MEGIISSISEQEDGAIREQLTVILESTLFSHADRLARFLKFVVEETLAGRATRLSQYAIAIEVFDRDQTFDPSIDAIVRVEAGRLRSKLLEYYDELGRADHIQINLPKRKYGVTFQHRQQAKLPNFGAHTDDNRDNYFQSASINFTKLAEPTVAVLPFINLSPDPEQEYFADGITEDLITDLSMLPGISVISRQSTFTYKGKAVTVQQVCEELGANLILEGSVRKLGGRVRITAQLIDGSSEKHLWAQRYDCNFDNIFAVQDEVNQKIVAACSLRLSERQRRNLERHGTNVIDAYDYVLRGMNESHTDTMEGSARARYCFERALELDPGYAAAYARLSMNYVFRWIQGWSDSREESLDRGLDYARRAVASDDQLAIAHTALCWAYLWLGEHDKAIAEGQLAMGLDPDDVVALERLALSMILAGEAELSQPLLDKAQHLNPSHNYDFPCGAALFSLSNYIGAIERLQRSFEQYPNFVRSGLYLAASHVLAGNQEEAELTVAQIGKLRPHYRLENARLTQFKSPLDSKRFVEALRQAGLT